MKINFILFFKSDKILNVDEKQLDIVVVKNSGEISSNENNLKFNFEQQNEISSKNLNIIETNNKNDLNKNPLSEDEKHNKEIQDQIAAIAEIKSVEFPMLAHDFFLDEELKRKKKLLVYNFNNIKKDEFHDKQENDSMLLFGFFKKHLINYPTPINLNYLWGFGSLIGIFLVIQIITGILLAMHYTPQINLAFASVEHIMRDVNYGWLIRYAHANGASFVFITLYLHIFRNLYYSSYIYPYTLLWKSGMLIFILMMATAFMGYVLPFGQMSFWGATVIINLFSAIPIVGKSLVYWLLGGYSVENATLNRFFSLHYFLPFLIAGLTLLHLTLLHMRGSSNPLGIYEQDDKIAFYPYFYFKDLVGFFAIMTVYFFMIFFIPML